MRDKQFLINEIEELLNVKICWHEEMADNGGEMADKHREQAEIYSECYDFFEELVEAKYGKNI
jgi:hypothetical protein